MDLNPDLIDVFTQLVLTYAASQQTDTALARCDRQLDLLKDSKIHQAIIHTLKGNIYQARKQTDMAEEEFKLAMKANPEYIQPYYGLARIYLLSNRSDEAIAQMEKIIEKEPEQKAPHMLLGTIYDIQRKFDRSEAHYRAALKIDPQFAPAANNLAYLLSEQSGKYDEALTFARIAKAQMPDDPSIMDTLGWIYYRKGLYDSAIQELSDSAGKLENNAVVRFHLGMAYYKKNQMDRAKSELNKALKLDSAFEGSDVAKKTLAEL